QAEDGIRDRNVTGVQTCALPISLRPLAGDMAFLLMALALIGTGVLAVPILTGSAAYAVAETFGWKSGLDEKPGGAKQFYVVMSKIGRASCRERGETAGGAGEVRG